jgi:hypothetical protein
MRTLVDYQFEWETFLLDRVSTVSEAVYPITYLDGDLPYLEPYILYGVTYPV